MRIGIDARELVGNVTGVGRYLAGLLTAWQAGGAAGRHRFVLYTHAPLAAAYSSFEARVLPGVSGTWWQQATLASAVRGDNLDALFAPQYTAPLLVTTPTVVVIYDVSFAAHPEWFRTREGVRLRTLARLSASRAREVITISEFSRREIAERLSVQGNRIHVIPPGIPPPSPRSAFGEARSPSTRNARLLYVGSIFNRRHVLDLIQAFAPIARAHRDASLDIVGDNRSYPFEDIGAAIEREQLGERIRWHRYAGDEQLADLYGHARAFAYFSEYEGLGLTPLEALAAGAPSVLYDTPVARESCGDAAMYVRPGDLNAATRALECVLFDEPLRTQLLSAAPAALAKFDWTRAAQATLSVIERC